ncbi:PilX N-terminal domain-containing pilus assembly protein [Thioflexithrix psekupsensis]|uniref:Type 4 fimbrial biogenesis protein PilX N-terminal domain-containing protein n=1 Tax=Thioflexithrix psekupsensis TaxID=1570016 RepID=A0A251X532_9GAMM|nr:PilX N-terminal domain-containing pilus assembly protein [Thioflexithrix psekupsensis]OUD12252.1 hypothetical protein TPSD3_14120 [Thioflexithrix psekupsensis]
MYYNRYSILRRPQRGAVLLVALMLLVVLTMLGISATQTTTIETRMAFNLQEYLHAFGSAEVGVGLSRAGLNDNSKEAIQASLTRFKSIASGVPENGTLSIDRGNGESYRVVFNTTRVPGGFPDTSGRYGMVSSGEMVHFITTSTGNSTQEADSPQVVLKSGATIPTPVSRNITQTIGDQFGTDWDTGDSSSPPPAVDSGDSGGDAPPTPGESSE